MKHDFITGVDMVSKKKHRLSWMLASIGIILSACANNGQKLPVPMKSVIYGAGIGAGLGAAAGSLSGHAVTGAVVGGAVGSVVRLFNHSQSEIVNELKKQDIQFITYGDTHVLVVPTDKYFAFNTHRFNDQCYPGLMNIVRLLRYYPCSIFYVAGFTDDIESRYQKDKLSQSRADAMLTFLWAHDIRAQNLRAEGYGDKFAIGDNDLIHGSAFNRRIEIEWINLSHCTKPPQADIDSIPMDSK
jgi:outer membrane protein OmpA-like peptidoglycan-associated protein